MAEQPIPSLQETNPETPLQFPDLNDVFDFSWRNFQLNEIPRPDDGPIIEELQNTYNINKLFEEMRNAK